MHLLDYVANDYSNAVSEGKVIDEFEYAEMQEFTQSITSMVDEVYTRNDSAIASLLLLCHELDSLVSIKQNSRDVGVKANELKSRIIAQSNMSVSPAKWPSFENGERLYMGNCQGCHGPTGLGDGSAGVNLEPKPTDFTNSDLMMHKSPLEAYHTITFGVDGTAMTAYPNLSEAQKWDLAFYVHSLWLQKQDAPKPDIEISLEQLASKSLNQLKNDHAVAVDVIEWYRTHTVEQKAGDKGITLARELIEKSVEQARKGKYDEARSLCLTAYLEGIEPVELQLKAQDPKLVQELELTLGKMRSLIESKGDITEIETVSNKVYELLLASQEIMSESEPSFWLTFSMAASVILREGLEAFLIIIIILSVLKKSGAAKAQGWVHGGWITAVSLGVIAWFFTDWLMQIGGMQRELLEGIVALIAVAILFYIGFWMHGKSEARKWNEFVKNRIQSLLNKQSMFGLAALSFLVVFREAFESVLFLSALNIDKVNNSGTALGMGVLVAFGAVAMLAYLMLRFSKRIPIAQLFKVSAFVIAILSIVLVGKGIHAIQETGLLSITASPISLRLGVLGIYPTIETLVAQLLMLGLTVVVWKWQNRSVLKPAQ